MHTTEIIYVDPTQTTAMNLESLAFSWGYQVSFGQILPVTEHDAEVTVTGRDALDFVIRFEEEIG